MRLLLALLPLCGCAMATDLVARPTGGYPAVRFVETVRFDGPVGLTVLEFPAGSALVADRRRADGVTLYCGHMVVRDSLAAVPMPVCAERSGAALILMAERSAGRIERTPPPGAVEETRL
ncbi:hypothetical protein [Paracraurococcus ruber]|uniref:Lipoprotein n=1 Tax=Paracraurococcus ruber TaxID=77675 RepID=A0ABS1CSM0_9PROT|nr:hypothetical protein [Paracraurococcus ruber]MBK1656839.1 hypothetical protein [Paracraurococcus ruber]TDG33954.1 hypothetical protein E2C05_01555 [Paracraurococcus ruber]